MLDTIGSLNNIDGFEKKIYAVATYSFIPELQIWTFIDKLVHDWPLMMSIL